MHFRYMAKVPEAAWTACLPSPPGNGRPTASVPMADHGGPHGVQYAITGARQKALGLDAVDGDGDDVVEHGGD